MSVLTSNIIYLPVWFPEIPVRQSPRLHMSLLAQMDGIIFALLGVRLEHDMFAACSSSAVCSTWGVRKGLSWSTSVNLYYPAPNAMALTVATAMSHQSCGLFVFSANEPTDSLIMPATKSASKKPGILPVPTDWRSVLASKSLLTFELPSTVLIAQNGDSHSSIQPMVAVFAAFN
jgi:hypothetical protein